MNDRAPCPSCGENLYGRTLSRVAQLVVTTHDKLSGTGGDIIKTVYACPVCGVELYVSGGKIHLANRGKP